MANKTVGVNIAFSADTSKAKAQIQELQTLLNKITYSSASSTGQKGLTDEIKSASAAAKELQYHLNNAYNANTGKLDLSLLDKSLKTTKSNITDLSTSLLSAGTTGQQAFVKIAQAISQAEQPMLKINSKVKDFANTLKNAAKYQIGNIVVQGFMSSLSSAVDYAKDLNTSLNEIRIVSGASADEMARFAEEANKSAKRLSATTLDYTKASTIFYQQGLDDEQVRARTETTLKMANVAGTSAQTVSDQMTAVWNNFYDGSKSLEYYSDVMVKLGAATASSTDEISEGVNKFAATAKTVGLSYEYATAALATVTATTRESADVVGNAFKTIFARLQGLNLGETLDDGTDLNKYSKALDAVGISIKEQDGELKAMDDILDELGEKWGTLADDQKMALAQTVAGTRQYSQLMALMNNWDYFKENLDVAYNSEGALEEQQQIYAESWDAAADRVQASIEGVYQAILDDKFFIKLNNGFANALGGLEAFIEGAGGVKTIITGIGSVMLGVFANKIPDALQTARYNFDLLTKGSEAAYDRIQKQMKEASDKAFAQYNSTTGGTGGIDANSSTGLEVQYANDLLAAKNKLALVSDKMSAAEEQQYKVQMSLIEAHQEETVALREQTEELERNIEVQRQEMTDAAKGYGFDDEKAFDKVNNIYDRKQTELLARSGRFSDAGLDSEAQAAYHKYEEYIEADETYSEIIDKLNEFEDKINDAYDDINNTIVNKLAVGDNESFGLKNYFESAIEPLDEVREKLENISNLDIDSNDKLVTMKTAISAISDTIPEALQKATGLSQIFAKIGKEDSVDELLKDVEELIKTMEKAELEGKDFKNVLKAFQDNKDVNKFSSNVDALAEKIKKLNGNKEALEELMNSFKPKHVASTTEALTSLASSMGSVATIGNTLKSLGETITNPDLSGWEVFSSIMLGLTSLVPMVANTMEQLGTVQEFLNGKKQALLVTMAQEKAAQEAQNLLEAKNIVIATLGLDIKNHEIQRKQLDQALTKAGMTLEELQQKLKEKGIVLDIASNTQLTQSIRNHAKEVVAILAENIAKSTNVEQTKSQVFWQTILNALTGDYGKLIMVGVALAIPLVGKFISYLKTLIPTQKNANEAISEANSAYEEEKNKVDELKSSLESLQDQIEQLESKDSLTLVEEEELAKLKEEEASLKRQLALQEQLANAKQREAARTFEDNFKSSSKWASSDLDTRQWVNKFDINGNQRFMTAEDYYNEYVKPLDNNSNDQNVTDALREEQAAYQELLANEEKIRSDYIEDNQENYNNLVEGYKNWLEQNPNASPTDKATYAEKIQQANKNFYGEDKWQEVVYGSVSSIKSDAEKQAGTTFSSWIDKAYMSGEELAAAGSQLAATFSDQFANELYANGIIPDQYAQWLIDQQQAKIEHVAGKLGEDGAEQLKKAMEDDRWTDTSLDILDQIDLGEIDVSNLDELFNAIINFYNTEVVQDLRADLEALITTTSELSIGDVLSEEDYQLLLKYNQELEKYFIYTGKGYKYLGGADEEIANMGIDEYLNKMQQRKESAEYFDTWTAGGKKVDWVKRSTNYSEGSSDYGRAQISNFLKRESAMDFISGIDENYTGDYLQNIIDNLSSDDEKLRTEAERLAHEFWIDFNEAYSEGSKWTDSKANEVRYSQAETTAGLEQIHNKVQDNEAYEKQLRAIAGKYEECEEALKAYDKAVKTAGKDSKKLQQAQAKLGKEVKRIEWKHFTDDALEYAQALKDAINEDDIKENLSGIQKALKEDLGFDVSIDLLDKYKDKFIEWGQAGEEASDDLMTTLYALIHSELFTPEPIEVTLDDGQVISTSDDMASVYDQVKAYIESNGITVSAVGEADLSGLVAELLASGRTAADVANALKQIGQTKVSFDAFGSGLVEYDLGTVEGLVAFINDLTAFHGEIQTSGTQPNAEEIQKAFGSSGFSGSGGGRHTGGTDSGGGGGSSKSAKHAEKKNDSDKERYHTIVNQLEDISAEYDDISEAAERAFGKDKLKNLDAQIEKTDELIDKQQEYLDAIEANLPVDKAVMDAYYQDTIGGPAIEYDERGNIANYDAIQDAMFAKYNAMADAYDEDSTEWQVFEKKYEQLEKYIEQYEETYDLLRDEEQEYQDLLNQRIDLQLEKVQYTVELKLNISEDQVKLLEYQLGKVEDDGFKSLEAIGLLTAKAGELNNQIQANKQGLNDALKLSLSAAEISEVMAGNMDVLNGKNFTEDQIEAIRDYRDELLDLNEQLDEIRESVEEKLMEAFDTWQEKLEKGIDTIDHYGSVLESYKNIIDIVGTDTLGLGDEFMNNLSQGSVDNAINKLEAAKAEYHAVESARAEAEKKLDEARASGDTKSAEMWESTLEDLTEKSQEAQENMLSAWEDALSKVAEQFEQSVERIVDNFNKSVYKLGGLEGLSNDFAKEQERSDMMLDDYEKIYELSKLSRDINKSIDDTDLIGGKQKLKKLLGEVNALQEDGVEMSQYDLEYLQKTYDLRLAELELEEAQRAKNTVRLSKDNEGNWSYVYTQNTDAVDAAQQKYEDALYAMQDLSSNYIDEMSEKLIETSQEMAEALAELRVEDFASIDEYYAEVDRVQKYYQEQMDFQEEELNKAIANNKTLYEEDWTAYHEATGYKISDTEDFVTKFSDSMLGGLMNSESDTANFIDLIAGSVSTMTEQLLAAANTYYENLANAMDAADTTVESFGEDAAAAIDEVVAKSDEGATAVENMADRMSIAVNDVMSNIQTWQQTYGAMMDQIVNDNLKVIESINDLVAALSLDDFDASVSWSFTPRSNENNGETAGFDTGGYTGSWGKEGKLAVLHEKELVLNANDTANMLDALRLTQELLEMIDLQAQTAKLGFGDLVATTLKDSQRETLEQKVEITAEFPNVTDHNEIEEALMNLTNTASQYANRK